MSVASFMFPLLLSRHVFKPSRSRSTVETISRVVMADGNAPVRNLNANHKVGRMRELLREDPIGGWNECWKDGVTPWDLERPTPIILHLLENDSLPCGRALVPGCGTGYDVVAIAGPERCVVGLDISENAISKAQQLFASSPNANYFSFLAVDFFKWQPDQLFDLIFDYTFFCAIEPCLRSAWAEKISNMLNPDGELITLMFPIEDRVGGPPYAVSVSDYEDVLSPLGFKALSVVDNVHAIKARKLLDSRIAKFSVNLISQREGETRTLEKMFEPVFFVKI